MKWIRPLHDEQTTVVDSQLITQSSQTINTVEFHPFYQALVEKHLTRSKGVRREKDEEHIGPATLGVPSSSTGYDSHVSCILSYAY